MTDEAFRITKRQKQLLCDIEAFDGSRVFGTPLVSRGHGKLFTPRRRWTASFAWNLYESLVTLGAFPVSYSLEPFIEAVLAAAERHGLVHVPQPSGAACWFHQDWNELGFGFTCHDEPCRARFDGQLAAMLFHGDAAILDVIDAELAGLAKEGARRRAAREAG